MVRYDISESLGYWYSLTQRGSWYINRLIQLSRVLRGVVGNILDYDMVVSEFRSPVVQSAEAGEYTEWQLPTPPKSFLDMTLNYLMGKFQLSWSFGECGVPLYCHRSQFHSGSEW